MEKLLFIGPVGDCTGNKSTAYRIKSFFDNCLLKGLDDFKNADDLNVFIKENDISCVICLHAFRAGRLLQNGCSVPYAVIFGGTDLNVFSKVDDNMPLMTKTVKGAKAVVAFSRSLENLAKAIWPDIDSKKIFMIPQGVSCIVPANDLALKKYHFMSTHHVFTLIAGLRSEKDPPFLLEAFQEWQDAIGNNGILLIIGSKIDRDYSDVFLKKIKKYPSVKYLGQLPQAELFLLLKHSFALVNSSLNEGMSNVILEAMFLGVPVLARAIEGNKALIEDGKNGLLYHSPEEFIAKAVYLMQNATVKEQLIRSAKVFVAQYHNPETEKEKYQQLVKMLLD